MENCEREIKTWDDLVKNKPSLDDGMTKVIESIFYVGYGMLDDKARSKIIATIKIYKLIELCYGGLVTKEDCKDLMKHTWQIWYNVQTECYQIDRSNHEYTLLTFKDEWSAREFMDNNKELIDDYFML